MGGCRVIELEDEVEGNQIGSRNYRFRKVGEPLPIINNKDDAVFDPQTPPLQPLALSQRFGVLFLAHSHGFCVARTKDVIESCAHTTPSSSSAIQDLSIVDLPIGKVSILTLSPDSTLLLVALVGATDLLFFSVKALLHKEQKPSFSCSLEGSTGIKDVKWTTKKLRNSYIVLSTQGKLYYGAGQEHLKDVADNVDAVDWSVKGNFVAVARNNVIVILSSKFEEKLSMSLPFKSFVGDSDSKCGIKVDTIRWVRPDCIVIGCFQLTDDGVEESYHVQVITSQDGKITNASSCPIVISFSDVFLGFVDGAVPSGTGPHMFLSYLEQCDLAFIANRKNMDQHVVLLGCPKDDKKKAATIEILNDAWLPRIDSQDNGDDNLILGLLIDNVSPDKQVKLILGEDDKEVSPCCVLLCLTLDGKVTVFYFASIVGASTQEEAICKISEEEEEEEEEGVESVLILPAQCGPENLTNIDEQSKEHVRLGLQSQETKEPAAVHKTSQHEFPRHVAKDLSKIETQKSVEVESNKTTVSQKPATDSFSQSVHRDSPIGLGIDMNLPGGVGSKTVPTSVQSWSSGKTSSSGSIDGRSLTLPSSGLQGKQSNNYYTISSNAHVLGGPLTNSVHSKDFTCSSMTSLRHGALIEGNSGSLPAVHSSHITSQESFTSGQSCNSAPNAKVSTFISGPKLSKQFLNVEEMAKELDTLMGRIDGLDAFSDSSIAHQRNSVAALEEGIWTLSERCRDWRGIIDECARKLQLILDKTVQVLARKVYIEGIVKQATDKQYWDLWNRQKLNSELELKRQRVLEVNQELTNQLIELERHFNSLELNTFGEKDLNLRAFQNNQGPSRRVNSLRSLHNTMSAQLAAAEQLSKCLEKQMAVLSIESPSMKKQNIRRELFETIGISYDDSSSISPDERKVYSTPLKDMSLSSVVAKEQPRRNRLSVMRSSEPETARRRRDSLDRNLSRFNPPKTTVKRMLLPEDHLKDNITMSSLLGGNQLSLTNRAATNCAEQSGSLAAFLYPSKLDGQRLGTQEALAKDSSAGPPISLFKADVLLKTTQTVAPSTSTSFPTIKLSSPEKRNAFSNSTDKHIGVSGFTLGNLKHEPVDTENIFSGRTNKMLFPAVWNGSAPSLSDSGNSKSDPGQLLPSSVLSFSSSAYPLIPSSSPTPYFPKPSDQAWSSAAVSLNSDLTASSTVNVHTVSIPGSLASTPTVIASASFSQAPKDLVTPSVSPSSNFLSKFPSSEVPKGTIMQTEQKVAVVGSLSLPKLQTGALSSKVEASLPTKPTMEVSTTSQSGKQLSFNDLAGSISEVPTEPKPKQSSATAPVLSSTVSSVFGTVNNGKSDSPDVELTQEDEMEEEAPEANQTTELTLGSLGGFGIGSAPNQTANKPNPFGAPFTNSSTNSPNPPFTMTVPGGELFKPASFSFQSPHLSQPSQPANYSAFIGGSSGTATQISPVGFGNPAQTGSGQQALGSVLGSFGQSRQLGAGLPGASVSPVSGFGGFVGNQSSGGFSNAPVGGGFASLASAGGGFSGLASGGGGFSGLASGGGGFSGVASGGGGFSGAASGGGGFSANTAGGFGAAGGGFGVASVATGGFGAAAPGGGFGAFGNQGSGGFPSFGGGGGVSERPPPHLLTQMRK